MKKIICSILICFLFANSACAFSLFKSKDTVNHAGENYASESDLIDSDIEAAEFFIYDNEDYIAQEPDVIEGKKKKWFNFKSRNKKVQKEEEVYIIEPEKKKNRFKKMSKKDIRKEEKKRAKSEQTKKDSSKEAQGMYETKFPEITSKIEYNDMNGEVTLVDCIKLALSNHPAIVSAISNAQIYESRIGQAWANYFPTISAGASYSRNDMLNTMGNNAYMRMMQQRYNMFYVPTITANMLLFDFGKTKANADMARRNYESSRFDAETSIESVIYNVKVAYYNMVFAQAQKIVYEDTVKDYELQLKQADAYYKIGKKAKIDVTTAQYNLGNAKVNLIKAKKYP